MICSYEKEIYYNPDNGYTVCKYSTEDPEIPEDARDKWAPKETIWITAFGVGIPRDNTLSYEFEGDWVQSDKYGLQYRVEQYREIMPKTEKGLVGYLGSGLIKGIGPKTAELIVDKFGLAAVDILENDPEQLLQIRGITPTKLEAIKESYQQTRSLREIVSYLSPFEVTPNKAAKIIKEFGGNALHILQNEPFRLCSISGFGFLTVDEIAKKTRCNLSDPLRIQSGLSYILDKVAGSEGHLFLPEADLTSKAMQLLNENLSRAAVTIGMVQSELKLMLQEGTLRCDAGRIYRPHFRQAEVDVAKKAIQLLYTPMNTYWDIERELRVAQKKLGIVLAPKQVEAVKMCFTSRICIITGGPGTGKTTTLQVILDIYQRLRPTAEILLTAPTGRASKRMLETTGFPSSSTLHKALGLVATDDGGFIGEKSDLTADYIVLDEMSMVDQLLAAELFNRLSVNCQLLIVGDPDQLQSVGPGSVLRELLRCKLIPTTHLDIVYRQAETSRITLNAHAINEGRKKDIHPDDDEFIFIPVKDDAEAAQTVLQRLLPEIEARGLDNVQILSPLREKGDASVQALNRVARDAVNPAKGKDLEYVIGSRIFRVGDKVMQTKNRESVSNGDIGFIELISNLDGETPLHVNFGLDEDVEYQCEDLAQLELAYACSIHKSQGGEYGCVILVLLCNTYAQRRMLRRNLLYTAVTRARKRLILVGQRQALKMAIDRNDVDKRNTLLADRIVAYHRKIVAKRAAS